MPLASRNTTYSSLYALPPRLRSPFANPPEASPQFSRLRRRPTGVQNPNPNPSEEEGVGGGGRRGGDGVLRAVLVGGPGQPHQPAAPLRLRRSDLPLLLQGPVLASSFLLSSIAPPFDLSIWVVLTVVTPLLLLLWIAAAVRELRGGQRQGNLCLPRRGRRPAQRPQHR